MQREQYQLNLNQEREKIEQKLRESHATMVRQVERRRFIGLSGQVRQIQRQVQLLGRI